MFVPVVGCSHDHLSTVGSLFIIVSAIDSLDANLAVWKSFVSANCYPFFKIGLQVLANLSRGLANFSRILKCVCKSSQIFQMGFYSIFQMGFLSIFQMGLQVVAIFSQMGLQV